MKKAINRKQLLGNSPFVNQGELDKSILELDEPGLVKRLFIEPQTKQLDQVSRIMITIPALEEGLPVPLQQDDDDAIQAEFLLEYLAREAKAQKQLTPQGQKALQDRLAAHMERLKQSDPKAAAALKAKGIAITKSLQAEQAQQAQQPNQDQVGQLPPAGQGMEQGGIAA
jgi:hypothetical protein